MLEMWTTEELYALAALTASDLETRLLASRMSLASCSLEKLVLLRRENLTAMLLKWHPGESTEFHSHGKSIGVEFVLTGVLVEQALTGRGWRTQALCAGEASAFEAEVIHRLTCQSELPAISLHVYANAVGGLDEITEFRGDGASAGGLLLIGGAPCVLRVRRIG